MFKLLPKEIRAKMEQEYSRRRMVIILTSFIVVLLIGMAGLFPAFVLSKVRKFEVSERARFVGVIVADAQSESLEMWLSKTNLKLKLLNPSNDKQYATEFIEKVIEARSFGVQLTTFEWAQSGKDMVLNVSGVALDRQTLLNFERALNNSGNFSKVTLPVSNLVKDRNISFQVKLSPIIKP